MTRTSTHTHTGTQTAGAFKTLAFTVASLATLTGLAAQPAFAADKMVKTAAVASMTSAPSEFIRVNKTLKGSVTVVVENGETILRVSDDFRASRGPDLKIFLNPARVEDVTGATATNGAVLVSVLKANKGSHDYVVPAGVDLAAFGSVLIHCEQFSVLWGGANLI